MKKRRNEEKTVKCELRTLWSVPKHWLTEGQWFREGFFSSNGAMRHVFSFKLCILVNFVAIYVCIATFTCYSTPSLRPLGALPHYFANGIWSIRVPNCTQAHSARNHTFARVAVTHFTHYFAVNCVQFHWKPKNRPLLHVSGALLHPCVIICVRVFRCVQTTWTELKLLAILTSSAHIDSGIAIARHYFYWLSLLGAHHGCMMHQPTCNLHRAEQWRMQTWVWPMHFKLNHCIHWIHICSVNVHATTERPRNNWTYCNVAGSSRLQNALHPNQWDTNTTRKIARCSFFTRLISKRFGQTVTFIEKQCSNFIRYWLPIAVSYRWLHFLRSMTKIHADV